MFLMISFQCFHCPLALKSNTNSNIRPSTGGRESNFPLRDFGRGNSAVLLPNMISLMTKHKEVYILLLNKCFTCIKYCSVIFSCQASSKSPNTTVNHCSLENGTFHQIFKLDILPESNLLDTSFLSSLAMPLIKGLQRVLGCAFSCEKTNLVQ